MRSSPNGSNLSGGLFGGALGPIGEAEPHQCLRRRRGPVWVIFTSAFIHLTPIHLAFNMFVLYHYGSLVERLYGHVECAVIYLLCAAGGSVLTILVDPAPVSGGASGAIFGLIGMLFVVSRRHHAVLGREARTMIAGIRRSSSIYLPRLFTFVFPGISWTGHVGGLIVGAVLGFFLPPTGVATMSGMWRTPSGERLHGSMPLALRLADLRRCRPGARGRVVRRGRSPDRLIGPLSRARVSIEAVSLRSARTAGFAARFDLPGVRHPVHRGRDLRDGPARGRKWSAMRTARSRSLAAGLRIGYEQPFALAYDRDCDRARQHRSRSPGLRDNRGAEGLLADDGSPSSPPKTAGRQCGSNEPDRADPAGIREPRWAGPAMPPPKGCVR